MSFITGPCGTVAILRHIGQVTPGRVTWSVVGGPPEHTVSGLRTLRAARDLARLFVGGAL